jgi:hypothetical protein
MQFSVPADNIELQIGDICSFIFDIPLLGKSYILGEIRYCRDFIDANQQPVIHYGVKFIKLSLKTWHHIKGYCQDEEDSPEKLTPKEPEAVSKTPPADVTLITRTFELIQVQIRPENGPELTGTVRDINYGGIKLQSSQPLPLHNNLSIRIAFLEHTVTANGSCIGCEDISGNQNSFLANICFTDIQNTQFDNLQSLMMKLASYMADLIQKSL